VSIGNFSSLKCDANGTNCTTYTVPLNDYSPSFFEYTEASTGRVLAAALDLNYVLAGTNHPISRGTFVQLYVNGLGPVNNQPASGEPSPAQPLATTKAMPIVMIGGQQATVDFSGLIPPYVGLYQVNVRVPTNISAGIQPLVIIQNGVVSKTSMLPVQ
jgi:minor extracellular serine protease Vpr